MSVKIRKLTRNNVWVDTDAIQAKESFGDDYDMYVSYCDSRRIIEHNGKHYECVILPIPKTLWDNLSELVISPKFKRARTIQQALADTITYLQSSIDCFDDAESICCWYDCEYTLRPDYYPNPILGL